MYSAVPKDYEECMVSKIGGIRLSLAHNAAFMVFTIIVMMLLWLLMGSPIEVENKGLSACQIIQSG